MSKMDTATLNEFIAECDEVTQLVNSNLSKLETGSADGETINDLYRSIHTLKGSAQLFGLTELGNLAHALETSLEPLRRGGKTPHPRLLQSFYQCVDLIEQMVRSLAKQEQKDYRATMIRVVPELIESSLLSYGHEYSFSRDIAGFQEDHKINAKEVPMANIPALVESAAAPATASIEKPAPVPATNGATPTTETSSNEANSTIRVPVNLLDKLMTLMGEMVLVRNQVLQYSNQRDDLEFLNLSQRLDIVTSELQGEVMKTRMQPIGHVLSKFQRVVRDLARDLGKKIELELVGVETELDKTLLEAIKDPLTHIVRNACDHGIESIEERRKAGKPETGTITIRAFHEGGQVIVEIADNGKGLYREKLIAKAIEKKYHDCRAGQSPF